MLTEFYLRQLARLIFVAFVLYVIINWEVVRDQISEQIMGHSQEITRIDTTRIVTFQNADQIITLKLHEITQISPNTKIFRFKLPSERHIVGLRPGQHIKMHTTIDGVEISRKYTHTSDDSLEGFVDFLVKIYYPNAHPDFPAGGKFTPHLDKLQINDSLNFSGPVGRIQYKGNGHFQVREKGSTEEREVHFKELAMVAGGSCITPPFQVLNAILKDPNDRTEIWLLFANQTPKDVLMKDYLDQMALEHPDRFHVWYTVNRIENDSSWNYSTGYITAEMLSIYLPAASPEVGVLLCGPKAMKNNACLPNLAKLGFSKEQIIVF